MFAVLLRKIIGLTVVYKWQSKVHCVNVVIMPYFQAISQHIAEILRFNRFSNGGRPPSWIRFTRRPPTKSIW